MSSNTSPPKVLLLAGGLGMRLRPLTDHTPKCLVPIAGRPLLDYWLDRFEEAGIREVVINTHHLPDRVRAHLERVNRGRQLRISESYEPRLLGSAGTVHANRTLADSGGDVLIVYADNLSNVNLRGLIQFHRGHGDPVTMMLFRTPFPERCGIAELDDQSRIVRFVEKPKQPVGNLANAGLYAVSAAAFREMADMNGFDLAFDVLPAFVGRMRGWVFDGYHLDIGTAEALAKATADAPSVFRPTSGAAI